MQNNQRIIFQPLGRLIMNRKHFLLAINLFTRVYYLKVIHDISHSSRTPGHKDSCGAELLRASARMQFNTMHTLRGMGIQHTTGSGRVEIILQQVHTPLCF